VSSIVLSASVRQNLLSLVSTAGLLATTQSRLSSGKKVNTALDNPTSYFTASALDGRASDISNLLDSIGNGVQVLQAANTGITQLEKLVGNAKSVASQALQTTVGYSAKSSFSTTAIAGATANNLLGNRLNAVVAGTVVNNDDTGGAAPITANTNLAGAAGAGSDNLATNIGAADSLVINGVTINFKSGGGTTGSAAAGTLDIDVTADDVGDVLAAIDAINGASVASTVNAGALQISTGTNSALTITGTANALTALGLTAVAAGGTVDTDYALSDGLTLAIASTGGGTATSLTFGTGTGEVNTLEELNAALSANNLQATISTSGVISVSTSNDAASATIGAVTGTAAGASEAFNAVAISAPVQDAAAQLARANLVTQYNNIIQQITNTAQDSSYAGVNLLGRDTLKLVFNETGKSTLSITGVTFDAAGLGLRSLAAGADFLDNNGTSEVLSNLNNATVTLRSQASALGSNLSIVQIRQEFSKSLVLVLQDGSARLTLADTNEEAANSQALATRQSIAVSALALGNQSQQSVLQLLR
jgi:flagellin